MRELPARFPKHRIIVRPHPIEAGGDLERIAARCPAARRWCATGAAVPWIMASRRARPHQLHHRRRGLRARQAGDLAAADDAGGERCLSRESRQLRDGDRRGTLAQLDRLIGPGLSRLAYPAEFRATFDRFFAGTRGPFACEHILDALHGSVRPAAVAPSARARHGGRWAGYRQQHDAHARASRPGHAGDRRRRSCSSAAGLRPRLRPRAASAMSNPAASCVFHVARRGDARRAHELPGEISAPGCGGCCAALAASPPPADLSAPGPPALQLVPEPGIGLQRPEQPSSARSAWLSATWSMRRTEHRRQRAHLLLDAPPFLPDRRPSVIDAVGRQPVEPAIVSPCA